MTNENTDLLDDFCRETEGALDDLEADIIFLKNYIFDLDFDIPIYVNFLRGLDIAEYLKKLNAINRVVHTVKGLSAFLDLVNVNKYCHEFEELTTNLAKGALYLNQLAFDIIENLPVVLNRFLEAIKADYSDSGVIVNAEVEEIKRCTGDLFQCMKNRIIHYDEISGIDTGKVRDYKKDLKVSASLSAYDEMLQGFQAFTQETLRMISILGADLETEIRCRNGFMEHLDRIIQFARSKIVLTRYPRLVSDLSKSLGKSVLFNVGRNEAYARPDIWDKCHNALVHLVRNSVDHGVENPAEREKAGKTAHGNVRMDVYEDFRNIYITIEDDGGGIDADEVGKKALHNKLIEPAELAAMDENQKLRLIFKAGFSTKASASDISGRGVGMDAVTREIEGNLNGRVTLISKKGIGTSFILEIPKAETLTECIIFGNQKYRYAIPVIAEVDYMECNETYISYIAGKAPVYTGDGHQLPLLDLFAYLHPEENNGSTLQGLPIIRLGIGGEKFGVVVPGIFGHERVKITRRRVFKKMIGTSDHVYGYGVTDPVTVVLDPESLLSLL